MKLKICYNTLFKLLGMWAQPFGNKCDGRVDLTQKRGACYVARTTERFMCNAAVVFEGDTEIILQAGVLAHGDPHALGTLMHIEHLNHLKDIDDGMQHKEDKFQIFEKTASRMRDAKLSDTVYIAFRVRAHSINVDQRKVPKKLVRFNFSKKPTTEGPQVPSDSTLKTDQTWRLFYGYVGTDWKKDTATGDYLVHPHMYHFPGTSGQDLYHLPDTTEVLLFVYEQLLPNSTRLDTYMNRYGLTFNFTQGSSGPGGKALNEAEFNTIITTPGQTYSAVMPEGTGSMQFSVTPKHQTSNLLQYSLE